jgi:hypothetical protein
MIYRREACRMMWCFPHVALAAPWHSIQSSVSLSCEICDADLVDWIAFLSNGTLMIKGNTYGVDAFAGDCESSVYLDAFARTSGSTMERLSGERRASGIIVAG